MFETVRLTLVSATILMWNLWKLNIYPIIYLLFNTFNEARQTFVIK